MKCRSNKTLPRLENALRTASFRPAPIAAQRCMISQRIPSICRTGIGWRHTQGWVACWTTPTPPNVYHLTLRERLFHGVRAIRLNPVEDDQMFGRDGMLAHSYMLGPSGQSNGCVSFKDYRKFLQAFLRGEVDRLVVVPDLASEHSRTARARRGRVGQYAFNSR